MQYYYRYVEGIVSPPGVALIVGSGTHDSVEQNLLSKRDNGKLLTITNVKDIAADSVRKRWKKEEPRLTPEELDEGKRKTKGRAIDMAAKLASLHRRKIAPKIEPVYVERQFILELKGFPFDLGGVIDVQDKHGIRDTKTRKNSPPKGHANASTQLTMYGLAIKTLDGEAPKRYALDFLVKRKKPIAVTQRTTRDESDFKSLLLRVEHAAKVIDSGAFMPTNKDSWICSEKWCGYWTKCDFGAKRRFTSKPIASQKGEKRGKKNKKR